MNRILAAAAFAAVLVGAGAALAQTTLQVGDKVIVTSMNNQSGTVVAIGGYASPGSVLVQVHPDYLDPRAKGGVWYDEKLAGVTKAGGAAAPAAAPGYTPAPSFAPPPAQGFAPAPAAPTTGNNQVVPPGGQIP